MKTRFNKLTAWLLTFAMLMTFIPSFTLTVSAADTDTVQSIQLGTSGISDPTEAQGSATIVNDTYSGTYKTPSDYVYFGVNGSDPIKWRVLDADKTNDGTTSGMFLLSEYLLASDVAFESAWNRDDNDGQGDQYHAWQNSDAQDWCGNFVINSFSTAEQAAFLGVAKTDSAEYSYNFNWKTSSLTENDKVFFLSVRELTDYVGDYNGAPGRIAYTDSTQSNAVAWWLRSAPEPYTLYAGAVSYRGIVTYFNVDDDKAARPAFNLDLSSVLFTSAAVGGKPTGFNTVEDYTGNEHKLTLKDSNRSSFSVTETAVSCDVGGNVTLNYSGAVTGANEYISAMIVDSNDNLLYYGQLTQTTSASGTAELAVPADLALGTYTLKLFNEQINGDYKTDYASDFEDIELTVEASAPDPDVDVLATDRFLVGSFNDWSTNANEFKLNADGSVTGYVSLELEANTTYEFKIVREGSWTSNASPITGTVEGLVFSSANSRNATITTTAAGTYVFAFGLNDSKLSVTYPVDPYTTYPLWVGGVQITSANANDVFSDGKVSYNPGTTTLTLNNAEITSTDSYGIYADSVDGFTIALTGENTVNSGADAAIYVERTEDNREEALTIMGDGSLNVSGESYGIYAEGDVIVEGGEVSATGEVYGICSTLVAVEGGTVTANGTDCGISAHVTMSGGAMTATGEDCGILGDVIVIDGAVTAKGTSTDGYGIIGYIAIAGGAMIATGGCSAFVLEEDTPLTLVMAMPLIKAGESEANAAEITKEALDGSYQPGTESYDGYFYTTHKYISITRNDSYYPVTVGGVVVSKENKLDVLGDGGSVTYDSETNTLILTNADITGIENDTASAGAGILARGDLNLKLVGENTLTGQQVMNEFGMLMSYAISVSGDLTISGGGSLIAEGKDMEAEFNDSLGIQATTITIESGTVTATGSSYGIYAAASVMISGGELEATGEIHGISSYGDVTVKGGSLTATATGTDKGALDYMDTFSFEDGYTPLVYVGDTSENAAPWDGQTDFNEYSYVFIYPQDSDLLEVTYTDGVEDEEIFADVTYQKLVKGVGTPLFGDATPTRDGYIFTGWSPAVADAVTENVTYTAQWERNHTITFNPNGGSVEPETMETASGKLESLPVPTRSGYTFNGWYDAETGGNKITTDTVFTENTTVYAQWTKNSSGGGGGSYSNTTTTTTKNEDGSTTKTTTNKSTGTVTEVTTNTDGSTTTVETKKDGTVTTTEKDKDGNTTTTVEKPDGTSTTTEKNKDGSEKVTEEKADGTTVTTEKDTDGTKTVTTENADGSTKTEETKKDGTTVTTETNADGETKTEIDLPKDKETEVTIPVTDAEDVTSITVTDKDGKETEITDFEITEDGVKVTVSGDCTAVINKAARKEFADVHPVNHWATADIDYAYIKGLMMGTSETHFSPDVPLTRAMLVTVLYRLEGEPKVSGITSFADLEKGQYYLDAVCWAQLNGIVNGTTDTTFAPNDNITREQIAAIMHRYAQYKGIDVSVGENTNILSYDDFDSISEYAIASMQYACGSGLMKGKTTSTLNPLDNATRAEIAAILHRFIEANK